MSSSLEDLIPLVNKLQDLVFNTIGNDNLDLPQVVVVGSQSSGKSSVLENIVGRDFLPRGTGIVTRRPLILQLINIPKAERPAPHGEGSMPIQHSFEFVSGAQTHTGPAQRVQHEEWGEFLHAPGHKYYDFGQIRREIETETERVAGVNKGVNRVPINLKIFSPHVLNLTLVDLPGLMKIPVGDQPTDIERQTRNLILEYIAKPNSIILAVSPANVDIVNSESLKLARQVDPQGKRTVGILTKIDLMDHGTNALDILSGAVYPLKLGFIGVVNRSQQDIHANKSLSDSLLAEKKFFDSHPAYRNISHRCGTGYLAKQLNTTLMNHIRERLPDIKAKLNTLMGQTEQELALYGDPSVEQPENKGAMLLQLMTSFATSFVASIDGTSSSISTTELFGGARLYYIYHNVFGHSLSTLDPTSQLSLDDIRTAIRNCTGPRPSLFVPELAFDLLVKPQITQLLEPPAQRCVQLVYEELMKIVHNCGAVEIERYPKLQTKLIEVVSELLRERLGPTASYVTSLIAIQRAYINTNHPDFIGAAPAMAAILEEQKIQHQYMRRNESALAEEEDSISDESTAVLDLPSPRSNPKVPKHKRSTSSFYSEPGASNASFLAGSLLSVEPTYHHHTAASFSANTNRDSFLSFFFGKDNEQLPSQQQQQTLQGSVFQSKQQAQPQQDFLIPPTANNSMARHRMSTATSSSVLIDESFRNEPPISPQELIECELIRRLILSYFAIVRASIQDQVPKAIMHLLVNYCKEAAHTTLVSKLYKEELFDELLHEDDGIAEEREKCIQMLKTYKDAARIIGEVV
jgi:dynamin 1-like protein